MSCRFNNRLEPRNFSYTATVPPKISPKRKLFSGVLTVLFAALLTFSVHAIAEDVAIGTDPVDDGSGTKDLPLVNVSASTSDDGGGGGGGLSITNLPGVSVTGVIGPSGGGSLHSPASTANTTLKQNSKKPNCDVGDPIAPDTGNKNEAVTEFSVPGEMGLTFARYYNSRYTYGNSSPGVSVGEWSTNLDYRLGIRCLGVPQGPGGPITQTAGALADADDSDLCSTANFVRPDGSILPFQSTSPFVGTPGTVVAKPGPFNPVGTAILINNGDGTYSVHDEDSRIFTFDSAGVLLSIKDASGIGWTLTHPDSNTVLVTHTNGQSFSVALVSGSNTVGTSKQVNVTDPAGNVYAYHSTFVDALTDAPVSHIGTINSVTYPGSPVTTVAYKYQAPISTGTTFTENQLSEVDYNGVAHDLTAYGDNVRASKSSLADGNQQVEIAYGSNATGNTSTVTNALGHVNVYQYDGSGNLVSISGNASARCVASFASNTYDAQGNLATSTDNNGNVTHYTYAVDGLLQQKIEAVGTASQRTTNYVWDSAPGADRLLSVTVVGFSKSAYAYNAQNRLASISSTNLSGNGTANQVLTTSFQYTLYPNGMIHTMSVIHPSPGNSDKDVYTYDALGNLASLVDGLGHATTYSDYSALGRPGHMAGPNGETVDFTYDGRNRVATRVTHPNGAPATWTYTYDGFGLTRSVAAPDGEVTTWVRDSEMRVNSITHNDKDGISTETIGYDALGDVTSEAIARGSDTGVSSTASYDELGRLYQKHGMHGQVQTYTYDANGNTLSVTNASGHVSSYQYDALNRVTTTTEGGGATPTAPSGKPTLTLPSSSSTGNYIVSWAAVSGATSYTLQEQANGGAWSTIQASGATSWSASGRASAGYGYRVQACNAIGCGPWSGTGTIAVAVVPAGAPSLSVPASSGSGAYTVSWTGVGHATSYTLQEKVNGGGWTSIYTGTAQSWSASGRVAGTYGYQVQACNSYGCSGWSTAGTVTVSIPIAINGQSYTSTVHLARAPATPGHPVGINNYLPGHGDIGIQIVNGTTWQVYFYHPPLLGIGALIPSVLASGPVPAVATTVKYTWTYVGVSSGDSDGFGSVTNNAASAVSISTNPDSEYNTITTSNAASYGRVYSVKVDFFNAAGVNISSSTCTLTARLQDI